MRMSNSLALALMTNKPGGDSGGDPAPRSPFPPTRIPVPPSQPMPRSQPVPYPGPVSTQPMPSNTPSPSPVYVPPPSSTVDLSQFVTKKDFADYQAAVKQSMHDMAGNLSDLQNANNQLVSALNQLSDLPGSVASLGAALKQQATAISNLGDQIVKGFRPQAVPYLSGKKVKIQDSPAPTSSTQPPASATVVDVNPAVAPASSGTVSMHGLLSPDEEAF